MLDHSKPNIYSVDLLTKEELIDHAIKDNNIDKKKINNIPETNFILSSKNDYCVSKCIKYLKFNYIYSSHNFEHFPNLIKGLNSYSSIMNSQGFIIAFIPDKRFEFDHFRKETSFADILSHYYENNNKSSFKNIFDQKILRTENDPVLHWNTYYGTLYNKYIENIGNINDKNNNLLTNNLNKRKILKNYIIYQKMNI